MAPAQGQGPPKTGSGFPGSRAPSLLEDRPGWCCQRRRSYRVHICKLLSKDPSPLRNTSHQVLPLPEEPRVAALPQSPSAVLHEPGGVCVLLEPGLFQVRKGPGSPQPSHSAHRPTMLTVETGDSSEPKVLGISRKGVGPLLKEANYTHREYLDEHIKEFRKHQV